MAEHWRIAELRAERDQLVSQVAAWDAEIERLGRLREVAEAAWGEMNARLHDLSNRQGELRMTVAARGTITGPDGRPFSGPTLAERDRYDALGAAMAAEERRYQEWVGERRMHAVDLGGLDRSWSTRNPTDLAAKQAEARRARAIIGQRLDRVEAEIAALTPGEQLQAGVPATEYVEHVDRVEALRERP